MGAVFALDGDKLVPAKPIFLLPKKHKVIGQSIKYKETDAEGISFYKGAYYLIGSHGRNKSGEYQDSRYFIYRVKVDASTGLVDDSGTEDQPAAGVEKSANLELLLKRDPTLGPHMTEKPDKGVNIEGIAVSGDNVYLGFRSPLPNNKAVVASISIKDAFDNPQAKLVLQPADLGSGMGVRDIAAVDGGFLILSGPQEDKAGPARVCFWKPGAVESHCQSLKKAGPDDSKPEALTLLDSTADAYKVLVISDGPERRSGHLRDTPQVTSAVWRVLAECRGPLRVPRIDHGRGKTLRPPSGVLTNNTIKCPGRLLVIRQQKKSIRICLLYVTVE